MQDGRRLTDRMITYWERLRKEDVLPNINIFRPEGLGDIWELCFSLNVISGGPNNMYQYDYVGRSIVEAFGVDVGGEKVNSNFKWSPGHKIIKKVDGILDSKKPIVEEGTFINKKDQKVKYRTCILPFTNSDEKKVNNVIVGLSWLVTSK